MAEFNGDSLPWVEGPEEFQPLAEDGAFAVGEVMSHACAVTISEERRMMNRQSSCPMIWSRRITNVFSAPD